MPKQIKVLLVSSSGGHLVQLSRIYEKLSAYDFVLMTTAEKKQVPSALKELPYTQLPEANQKTPLKVIGLGTLLYKEIIKIKPDVVISTGAAPGAISLLIAKLRVGSSCIWVDSLANTQQLSLSGRLVKRFCDLWLSQWEDVAEKTGATYMGKVI